LEYFFKIKKFVVKILKGPGNPSY